MKEMLVVVIEPEEPARKKTIGSDLKSMQDIVGGYIETIPAERIPGCETLRNHNMVLVLNEEGKLLDLPLNFPTADMTDYIVGTAFVCKVKSCEMVGLSDKEADLVIEAFYRKEKDRLADTGTAFFKTTFSQFISNNSGCQGTKGVSTCRKN